MRELNSKEIEGVHGGFGAVGLAIGAAVGVFSAWKAGGSFSQVLGAGALGGLAGMAGNFAASAATGGFIMRAGWGLRSVGLGFAAGQVVSEDSQE